MHRHQSFNFSRNGWGDSEVQAKLEFLYQNCVKLKEHGGAHKHGHPKYMFHHKFSPYFSNYMLWSQKLRIRSKLSEWNWRISFPHKCLLLDVILNEGINKLIRRKHFLWQKFFLRMSVCRKCKHYPQGSFVLLSFYGELLAIYRFSSNFACPYFSVSHFGCPPVFWK